MNETTDKGSDSRTPRRPVGPYWEDAVYRYVSGQHRSALVAENPPEADRFDGLMQQLVEGSMPNELYWQLDAQIKADQKKRQQQRKRHQKHRPVGGSAVEQASPVNIAALKKRIFNRHVSRQNIIKALEALPQGEKKATIAGLPPGLRRKLGSYLKGAGR